MGIQESYLKAIADAIRSKTGSMELIPASNFANSILSIDGGGSEFAMPLQVKSNAGSEIIATLGETSVSNITDNTGTAKLILPKPGDWKITSKIGDYSKSDIINVSPEFAIEISLYSSLPEGYTQLDYIESNGTQYIDTKINWNDKTKAIIDLQPTSAEGSSAITGYVYGSRTTVGDKRTFFYEQNIMFNSTKISYYTSQNSAVRQHTTIDLDVYLKRMIVELELENCIAKLKIDSTINTLIPNYKPSTFMSLPIYLLWFSSDYKNAFTGAMTTVTANKTSAKLYGAKIYQDSELKMDLIPAKDSSDIAGMYDLVNNQFLKSATSTAFTAGPILSSPV